MNNCLVICNGEISDYTKITKRLSDIQWDHVISVDGGIQHARRMNISVNTAIGDFDSISSDNLAYLRENQIDLHTYPSDKDKTDTELALDYCITEKASSITIVAYNGSRLDHSLANILMFAAKSLIIPITLASENNIAHYVHEHISLAAPPECYVSIIPITETVTVQKTWGLKYMLNNTKLGRGETVGVSNYAVEKNQSVSISEGIALITISND